MIHKIEEIRNFMVMKLQENIYLLKNLIQKHKVLKKIKSNNNKSKIQVIENNWKINHLFLEIVQRMLNIKIQKSAIKY